MLGIDIAKRERFNKRCELDSSVDNRDKTYTRVLDDGDHVTKSFSLSLARKREKLVRR